jgi:hypothetical protein
MFRAHGGNRYRRGSRGARAGIFRGYLPAGHARPGLLRRASLEKVNGVETVLEILATDVPLPKRLATPPETPSSAADDTAELTCDAAQVGAGTSASARGRVLGYTSYPHRTLS